jgi:hypothetical protein
MSVARRAYDAVRLWQPPSWTGSTPRGVVVLGMHRSGTSAATRLVNVLGPATCAPGEMVRGPWNPSGHFESRALMHLNNALLTQMGRTWWYPPPAGEQDYEAVAARITITRPQARRAFRRVHRTVPWVWKDPRTSVLLPYWRSVLGDRLAAVVVVRNPIEVAVSMQRRHGVPVSFGVALWERYNRLILLHSAGLPVLVTRYDDLVDDPAAWSEGARTFLAGLGMRLDDTSGTLVAARDFVDADLRHSTHTRADVVDAGSTSLAVYDALEDVMGPSASFRSPPLPPEPSAVATELDTVGPDTELAWHPPPWAPEHDGTSQRGPKAAHEK